MHAAVVSWDGGGEVRVRHFPLPYPGGLFVPAGEIAQLYVKETHHVSRNGETLSYEVGMMMRDSSRRVLVKNLPNSQQARFIEQEIEKYLHIQDAPVSGEYQG